MQKSLDRFFCWFIGCDRCTQCGKLISKGSNCVYCLIQKDALDRADEELIREFELTIVRNADAVDPDDTFDWHALTYGFFLGKGRPPAAALALVNQVGRKRGLR